jgi:hypothetical protein
MLTKIHTNVSLAIFVILHLNKSSEISGCSKLINFLFSQKLNEMQKRRFFSINYSGEFFLHLIASAVSTVKAKTVKKEESEDQKEKKIVREKRKREQKCFQI